MLVMFFLNAEVSWSEQEDALAENQCHPPLTVQENANRAQLFDELLSTTDYSLLIQPVVFHVIYKRDGTGLVPFNDLYLQVAELNKTFSSEEARIAKYGKATNANIRFELHAVKYIQQDTWHDLCALPSVIKEMRPQIMLDPAHYFNIYVCFAENNLGLSWLPYQAWYRDSLSESHYSLGAIIHWQLLPGNTFKGGLWRQGDIMVHEAGHHYGLMHPYEEGCWGTEANSDGIADTPRQAGNPFGSCARRGKLDSCKRHPGKDDIQNYMGAYQDGCRSHFTPGQVKFMRDTISVYKPTLVRQLPVSCVSAVDATDKSPDLLPCVGSVVRENNSPPWCKTSKTDSLQWGRACCPAKDGSRNGENNCRIYDPLKVNPLEAASI